jgi:hypothetical protein
MSKAFSSVLAAQPSSVLRLAEGVTVAVSMALLLAPHPAHAAPPAPDSDALGSWSDGGNPPMTFSVQAGPRPGTLRVVVPARAAGLKAPATLVLVRTGPRAFASPKGAEEAAKFAWTDPRHAEFRMVRDNKQGFGIIDILLARQ